MRPPPRVIVIGAGVAGLVSALLLAARGLDVTVIERAARPGGKMREVMVGGRAIDAGPTVFTLRRVFDEICDLAGTSLESLVTLKPIENLARHAWSEDQRMDLFADMERTMAEIDALAGPEEAARYGEFCGESRRVFESLEGTLLRSSLPSPHGLARRLGLRDMWNLGKIVRYRSLWDALGRHFKDPRLRQLFGRYATYSGSSPFQAPAPLMVIAHVERDGVWVVEGGMHRLAEALAAYAEQLGAQFRYGEEVREILVERGAVTGVRIASGERLDADYVIMNGDVAALSDGRMGEALRDAAPRALPTRRSLSAMTWTLLAETDGFPLVRHNVFFGGDYASEFRDIFERGRLPRDATVYVCAQDRDDDNDTAEIGAERLLCLVNAPACGDQAPIDSTEIAECEERSFSLLKRCGLTVRRSPETSLLTTPADFDRLFPATGGALYGQAAHGWMATFNRPRSISKVPGLYLAGGSVHPGPGVPMAATSGRLAVECLLADLDSTAQSRTTATSGGILTG